MFKSRLNIKHRITEGLYAYKGLFLDKKKPTIVYSNGHVSSMSLFGALRKAGHFSFKIEHIANPHILSKTPKSTQFVRKHIVTAHRPAKFVSLVRDPMSMMISYFFSRIKEIPEAKQARDARDVSRLQEIFIEKYLNGSYGYNDLAWFDREINNMLWKNVYMYPFNKEEGFVYIDDPKWPILIMRTELPNEKKSELLKKYYGLENVVIERYNQREQKPNADLYAEFKKTLKVPKETLDRIYTSHLVQYFLSQEEINRMKSQFFK